MNTTTPTSQTTRSKMTAVALATSLALSIGAVAPSVVAVASEDVGYRGNPTQLPEGVSPAGTVWDGIAASLNSVATADARSGQYDLAEVRAATAQFHRVAVAEEAGHQLGWKNPDIPITGCQTL